jgi:hypothetical protein
VSVIYEGDATVCPECGQPIEDGDRVLYPETDDGVVVHEGCL